MLIIPKSQANLLPTHFTQMNIQWQVLYNATFTHITYPICLKPTAASAVYHSTRPTGMNFIMNKTTSLAARAHYVPRFIFFGRYLLNKNGAAVYSTYTAHALAITCARTTKQGNSQFISNSHTGDITRLGTSQNP